MDGAPTQPGGSATAAPTPLVSLPAVGTVLAGRYRIDSYVARGGMACIFRAQHLGLDNTVAVKFLDPSILTRTTSDAAERFTREARLASRLKHPSIVEVFDFGVTDEGLPYIVMEFLEGCSLAELLAAGPLPWARARRYVLQILGALQVAHEAGMVHRDIKPENCFVIDELDLVKVLDFGIAKVMNQAQRLTADGSVMGTPHYLAPEQARAGPIDERTDVYAVAVTLYEMLSGTCPFEDGTPLEIIAAHINAVPPPLGSRVSLLGCPAGLESLLDQALAKEPANRPRDAGAFAEAILGLEHAPVAKPRTARRWIIAAAAAATFGVLLGGAAAILRPGAHELVGLPSFEIQPGIAVAKTALEPGRDDPAAEAEPAEEAKPAAEAEPEPQKTAKPRPRPPRKPVDAGAKLRRAVARSDCGRFAGPGGAKVGVRASVSADGTVGDVVIQPPYDHSELGRCVERVVGRASLGSGHGSEFSGRLQVGGAD